MTATKKPAANSKRTRPASMVKEADIQAYLLKQLAQHHTQAYVVKTVRTNHNGTPDVLICHRGHFLGVEVKRPRYGRISALQVATLMRIESAGGTALVVSTFEEVDELITRMRIERSEASEGDGARSAAQDIKQPTNDTTTEA